MNHDNATRRGFFIKAGAVLSAPAALTSVHQAAATESVVTQFADRLAELEDANALRRIGTELIGAVNAGSTQALECPDAGLREIVIADFDANASAEFSEDRRAVRVSVNCTASYDEPIDAPGSTLLDMARAQGEGFVRRLRPQVLELSCAKSRSVWILASARLR